MNKLNLRDASEVDAPIISELIYSTEDSPKDIWGSGTKEEILNRIQWLVRSSESRYSYRNTKIAELDGKCCGAIILLKSEDIAKLDIKTSLKLVYLIKGIKRKINFIKSIILSSSLEEGGAGEFYIANLATSKEVRGKGIGKALIKLAEETAKKEGYRSCSLLAKDEGVKSFYEKLDYKFEREEEYFSHSLYKMVKCI